MDDAAVTVQARRPRRQRDLSSRQDGLPLECPYDPLWDALVPLPDELAKTVWADDGHNTVGKAAGPLKKWALANMVPLKRAGTKIVWSVSLVEPVHRGEIVVFGGPNCRADVKGMLGVVVGEHGVISVDIPALKERRTFTDAVPGYLSGFHRYVGDRPENMRLRLFVCTRNDCTHTAAAVKSWVETNTESLIEKAHTVLDRCPECGSPINFIL